MKKEELDQILLDNNIIRDLGSQENNQGVNLGSIGEEQSYQEANTGVFLEDEYYVQGDQESVEEEGTELDGLQREETDEDLDNVYQ